MNTTEPIELKLTVVQGSFQFTVKRDFARGELVKLSASEREEIVRGLLADLIQRLTSRTSL